MPPFRVVLERLKSATAPPKGGTTGNGHNAERRGGSEVAVKCWLWGVGVAVKCWRRGVGGAVKCWRRGVGVAVKCWLLCMAFRVCARVWARKKYVFPFVGGAFGRYVLEIRRRYYCTAFSH